MPGYELSPDAYQDLAGISEYGIKNFGDVQAAKYHAALENTFELLSIFTRIGLPSYDLQEGLYRFPHKSHMIFYVHEDDQIRIVRVLNGRADFKRYF